MAVISPKKLLKKTVFGISLLMISPMVLASSIEKVASKSETIFVAFAQALALLPGKFGSFLRSAYYFGTLEKCSWESHIGFGSFFSHRAASLGANVSMGSYCVMGTVAIAEEVVIASRVSVPSGKRQHLDESGEISPEPRFDRIRIGKGSWIGEGAIVLADVGQTCIVSAGAVVIHDAPDGWIIGGNPAKPLKPVQTTSSTDEFL